MIAHNCSTVRYLRDDFETFAFEILIRKLGHYGYWGTHMYTIHNKRVRLGLFKKICNHELPIFQYLLALKYMIYNTIYNIALKKAYSVILVQSCIQSCDSTMF